MRRNQRKIIKKSTAADTPQQTPTVTPEGIIQQLRAVSAQIPEVTPLTSQQREVLRRPRPRRTVRSFRRRSA